MQVVWFKRDLRTQDHGALSRAAERGPVLPLYVVEPDLWAEPDMAARHWDFVAESLKELQAALAELGQPLIIRQGEITQVLAELAKRFAFAALWSHEETGNGWTYARDRRVAAWCRDRGLPWHEVRNHGVQRRLSSRDGWARAWDAQMARPVAATPALEPVLCEPGAVPGAKDLGLAYDPSRIVRPGGALPA